MVDITLRADDQESFEVNVRHWTMSIWEVLWAMQPGRLNSLQKNSGTLVGSLHTISRKDTKMHRVKLPPRDKHVDVGAKLRPRDKHWWAQQLSTWRFGLSLVTLQVMKPCITCTMPKVNEGRRNRLRELQISGKVTRKGRRCICHQLTGHRAPRMWRSTSNCYEDFFSGTWHHAVWQKGMDIPKDPVSSIIRVDITSDNNPMIINIM